MRQFAVAARRPRRPALIVTGRVKISLCALAFACAAVSAPPVSAASYSLLGTWHCTFDKRKNDPLSNAPTKQSFRADGSVLITDLGFGTTLKEPYTYKDGILTEVVGRISPEKPPPPAGTPTYPPWLRPGYVIKDVEKIIWHDAHNMVQVEQVVNRDPLGGFVQRCTRPAFAR